MVDVLVPSRKIIYDDTFPTVVTGSPSGFNSNIYEIQRQSGERGTFQFYMEDLGSPTVLGELFIAGFPSRDTQGIGAAMNLRGPIDLVAMGAGSTWIEDDVPLLPRMFVALPAAPLSGWVNIQMHIWFMQ